MLNSFYFILGRDVAARFEIICTNVLGLACKSAAILGINKLTMKTDNIRKFVRKNYVTTVYKNWDCPRSVADFFLRVLKKYSWRIFLTVMQSGNRKHNMFFFRPNNHLICLDINYQMNFWDTHFISDFCWYFVDILWWPVEVTKSAAMFGQPAGYP